jgi:DNA polymerase-3 subunit gamma/tau
VLYGKWRPQNFDEVVGQDQIVTTLRNALETGQIAHAYLFSGPRGTGKTTMARILARAVNCANLRHGQPCNECPACKAIASGTALDLIEMDAASNRGIDDIRDLREKIAYAPSDLKSKVYLLDEVHMLTKGAFNALLKTLEEPPPHAFFILATTELHEVPATVVSRCQRYDFRRVPIDAIVGRLAHICAEEGFSVQPDALELIAKQARGGLRDAITLLEQAVAQYGGAPTRDDVLAALGLVHDERVGAMADAILDEDLSAALLLAREVADDGIDMARFTRGTIDELRERQRRAAQGAGAGNPALWKLSRAIAELARADFRQDPASPVPLEVACAAAILGQPEPATSAPADGGTRRERQGDARPLRTRRERAAEAAAASPEEQFVKDLYERCRMVNVSSAGWLNGSCEVLSMEGDRLELGFYHKMHMNKVDSELRTMVEQQAQELLGRPVSLAVKLIERSAKAAAPRGGHLAEAALAMGAKPVEKD